VSATKDQVAVHISTLRSLLVANAWLFDELMPKPGPGGRGRWSAGHVRLTNGAEVRARAFGTQVRGLHPDLLMLDDVVSDSNARTSSQRERAWRYFIRTLLPMHPRQILVVGTPLHRDDLLHRLAPRAARGTLCVRLAAVPGPRRGHRSEPLAGPPPALRTPPAAGRPGADEFVVLGLDPAVSGATGADYTVAIVAAVDWQTKVRTVLAIWRQRGVDHAGQLALVRRLFEDFSVTVAMVEQNGFQNWLVQELQKLPLTAGRVFGHNTGLERSSPDQGIPVLAVRLDAGLWTVPSGDPDSRMLAAAWQDELEAYGWRDGRLGTVGEHDDPVYASWFVERAIA